MSDFTVSVKIDDVGVGLSCDETFQHYACSVMLNGLGYAFRRAFNIDMPVPDFATINEKLDFVEKMKCALSAIYGSRVIERLVGAMYSNEEKNYLESLFDDP